MGISTKLNNLGVLAAQNIINALNTPDMNFTLYLTISHIEPWANDSAPPAPNDNITDKINVWEGMIGGKRITGNDVSLGVPLYNWAANTTYIAYLDNISGASLFGQQFYILTSNYGVYKCLSNNNSANSTVMPTYTNTDRINTEADGYTWKYMLTLSTNDRARFLTGAYMPIRTLALNDGSLQWKVQQAAIDGSLNIINVINGGIGFTNASNLIITISGDGTGATATGQINTISQTISNVTITNPGSLYHFANVAVSGGGGSAANLQAVISPHGGHGSNPINELGASNLIINIRLDADENMTLPVQPDYRQVAIIQNPKIFGTSNTMSNTGFSQTFDIDVSAGFGNFSLDEIVFQGGNLLTSTFSGKVASWDSSNNVLYLTEIAGTPSSAVINGFTSGISRFVLQTFNQGAQPYSGTVIYIDNISPIQRAEDQIDNIVIPINF